MGWMVFLAGGWVGWWIPDVAECFFSRGTQRGEKGFRPFFSAVASAVAFVLPGVASLSPERWLLGCLLVLFLLTAASLDLSHRLIPNGLNLTAATVFATVRLLTGQEIWFPLGAACFGGGALLAVALLSRGGMGGGDIKMAAAAGLAMGWPEVAAGLGLAILSGGLWSFFLLITGKVDRKTPLPFAPHLAVGFYAGYLWGEELVRRYLSLFG